MLLVHQKTFHHELREDCIGPFSLPFVANVKLWLFFLAFQKPRTWIYDSFLQRRWYTFCAPFERLFVSYQRNILVMRLSCPKASSVLFMYILDRLAQ